MKTRTDITSILTHLNLPGGEVLGDMPLNETVCHIPSEKLMESARLLLESGCWHLSAITALEEGDHMVLLYHFWLYGGLTLQVPVFGENARMNSITEIIPGAAFYEREIQELFGICFDGLTHKEALFLAEDWDAAPPMRSGSDAGSQSSKKTEGRIE